MTGTATTATPFTVSGSKAGDMYINTSTFNIYRASAANTWVYVCNIKGAKGDKGNPGAKGDPGVKGDKGDPGAKGDPGVNATTTATGTENIAGLTKLYSSLGQNTDGTINQNALRLLLNGKSNDNHTHYYAGSDTVGGPATSTLMIKDNAVGGSNSDNIIISYNSTALTSADYIAAWNSSGSMIQKISSSKINAGKVNGHTVNSDVPSGAKFTDTTYSVATTSTAGLMSAKDKTTVNNTYSILADSVDWNTLITTGIYHVKTQAGTNRPTTHWGTLYVNGDGTVFQIWIPDVNLTSIYKRYKSGSWSDWAELKLTDNDHYEKYTVLQSGDFDSYTGRSDGIAEYYTGTFGVAAGNLSAFENCPESPSGSPSSPSVLTFVLKVYKGVIGAPTRRDVVWQEYTNICSGKQYVRNYKNSEWSDWLIRDTVSDDTKWKVFTRTELDSGISAYGTGTGAPCHYRKIGNVVYIEAMFTTSVEKGPSNFTIATLPVEYRPSHRVVTVQQGSNMCRWTASINTAGVLSCERYSSGASYQSVASGSWLCCYFSYHTD